MVPYWKDWFLKKSQLYIISFISPHKQSVKNGYWQYFRDIKEVMPRIEAPATFSWCILCIFVSSDSSTRPGTTASPFKAVSELFSDFSICAAEASVWALFLTGSVMNVTHAKPSCREAAVVASWRCLSHLEDFYFTSTHCDQEYILSC